MIIYHYLVNKTSCKFSGLKYCSQYVFEMSLFISNTASVPSIYSNTASGTRAHSLYKL